MLSLVRYGNVAGSRGSVIPLFKQLLAEGIGILPVTDERMTRFWITMEEACEMVIHALTVMKGGETFIKKIPSFKIHDLVEALGASSIVVGSRPGEKLHEIMVTQYDNTYDYKSEFIVYPMAPDWWNEERVHDFGCKVDGGFEYSSDTNEWFLSIDEIKERLEWMGH